MIGADESSVMCWSGQLLSVITRAREEKNKWREAV